MVLDSLKGICSITRRIDITDVEKHSKTAGNMNVNRYELALGPLAILGYYSNMMYNRYLTDKTEDRSPFADTNNLCI